MVDQEIVKGVGGITDLGETDFLTLSQEIGKKVGDNDLSNPGPLYPIKGLYIRAYNPEADKIKELLYT